MSAKEAVAMTEDEWKELIIPIPSPTGREPEELYLPMAYEPYDWIKDGEKTTEFREYNPYWVKRILACPPKRIKFQRGYGGPGRPAPEQMVWTVTQVTLYNYSERKECDPHNVPFGFEPDYIAMDLGERIS